MEMSLGDYFFGGTLPKANSLNLKIGLLPLKENGRFIDPNFPTIDFQGLLLSVLGQGKITIPLYETHIGRIKLHATKVWFIFVVLF